MKRPAFFLLVSLCAGCAEGLHRVQQMHDDASPSVQLAKFGRTCEDIGHAPGTPGYHRCIAQLSRESQSPDAPKSAAPREDSPIEETVREH